MSMALLKNVLLRVAGALIIIPIVVGGADVNKSFPSNIITKDIAILGGGASGAHASVRLREDLGKSVVVIEKQDRLGGHVATYTDPNTGIPYDYGVQSYIDYPGTREFFARFNISVTTPVRRSLTSQFVDFDTGKNVSDYIPPTSTAVTAALIRYRELCELYEDMLLPGYWNFPPPDQIPSDLLLDFGDFARKNGIEAAIPQLASISIAGLGDPTTKPTMYVMQALGAPLARDLTEGSTFVPASHNNSELYGRISDLLGDDVLYSSKVVSAERNTNGVELIVEGREGHLTLIRARRLLVAIEPTLEGMEPLDLDQRELEIFNKWNYSTAYAAIVAHPSLPINGSVINIPSSAAPSNYLIRPQVPFIGRFDHMSDFMFRALIIGDEHLSRLGAMDVVQANIDAMINEGTLPFPTNGEKVRFIAFSDHGPMHLRVSPEELKEGFVQTQYALQGHRATWYTGAAWSVQFTSILWAFSETIFPLLVKDL